MIELSILKWLERDAVKQSLRLDIHFLTLNSARFLVKAFESVYIASVIKMEIKVDRKQSPAGHLKQWVSFDLHPLPKRVLRFSSFQIWTRQTKPCKSLPKVFHFFFINFVVSKNSKFFHDFVEKWSLLNPLKPLYRCE